MSLPKLIKVVDHTAFGEWDNLCIQVYFGPPTLAAILYGGERYREAIQRHPGGISVMTIVQDGVPLPDEATRSEVSKIMGEMGPGIRAMIGVHEAPGFVGAAVRSILAAIALLSKAPYKINTAPSVKEASGWLAPYLEPARAPSQVELAILQFRKLLAEHRLEHL